MAAAAMTYLPPPLTTTTGWLPTARCCRHRHRCHQCCRHHALTLASAITIAAAFANVIAPPTFLLMVDCCVICRPLPAASSAIQIYEPPPSCDCRLFRRLAAVPFCRPSPAAVCRYFIEHQTPLPLPLKVGCCILCLPSSIPTTSPS